LGGAGEILMHTRPMPLEPGTNPNSSKKGKQSSNYKKRPKTSRLVNRTSQNFLEDKFSTSRDIQWTEQDADLVYEESWGTEEKNNSGNCDLGIWAKNLDKFRPKKSHFVNNKDVPSVNSKKSYRFPSKDLNIDNQATDL
jgi:hypothetical protein